MSNLYMPFCGLLLSSFMIILFYIKAKKFKNTENLYYFFMIIDSFLATVFCLIAIYLIYCNKHDLYLVTITNRLECFVIFNFVSNWLMYIYTLCYNKRKIKIINNIINIIVLICMLFLPISLDINADLSYMVVVGPPVILANVLSMIYLALVIYMAIVNRKKLDKKIIPVDFIVLFFAIIAIVRNLAPNFTCVEFLIALSTLIMYQTIENPDLKMLEEYKKNKELVEENFVSKTNILFRVYDDIRSPIKKIKQNSEQILITNNTRDKNTLAHNISHISDNINNSIDNIYNISNFDKQNIKLYNTSYNTYNLFSQIIYMVKNKDNNIHFKYSISEIIPDRLLGDSTRIKQIIYSLILNKNIEKESGLVDLDIYAITKNDMCRLIFTIQTNLCKYDLTYINSILSSHNETDYKDIDIINNKHIDLKNVKKIIDLLGGTLLVSIDDEFMTFKVIINQLIDTKTDSNKLDNMILKYSNKKKVLVVDDDYKELTIISNELKKNNFDVVCVMHEKDCIDKLNSKDKFDILILDDEMKNMSAVNLIEEIDKFAPDNLVKIVMLGNDKDTIKKHYIYDYSFVDYLLKDNYKDEIKRLKENYK